MRGGDKGMPDYLVISPYKNWAAYGAYANPAVWKMVEGADGKPAADAPHKSPDDVLQDVNSHVDSYSAELTNAASGK